MPERVNIVLIQPKQESTIITTGAKPMPPAPSEEAILEQPEKIPQASKNRVRIKPAPAPSGKRASKQTIKDKVTKHKRVHETETISQSLDKANLTLQGTSTQVERQPEIATLATGNNPNSSQLFNKSRISEVEGEYKQELLLAIEQHKRYPESARRRGIEGDVQVRFTVLQDGTLAQITIAETSGWMNLDQAALKSLEQLQRFKPIPPALKRNNWEFLVTVHFTLE